MELSLVRLSDGPMATHLEQPTETRLALPKETNLAQPKEMPKDKSLACLSDGQMAMQTVEMMEMGWV